MGKAGGEFDSAALLDSSGEFVALCGWNSPRDANAAELVRRWNAFEPGGAVQLALAALTDYAAGDSCDHPYCAQVTAARAALTRNYPLTARTDPLELRQPNRLQLDAE